MAHRRTDRETGGLLIVLALAGVLVLALIDWVAGESLHFDGRIIERVWSPGSSSTGITTFSDGHGNIRPMPVVVTTPESLSLLVEGEGRTLSIDADVERWGHLRPGDRVKAIEVRGWSGIVYRRGLE